MKKILITIFLVLFSVFNISYNNIKKQNTIPKEAIRFRVIANSNTLYDQNIKTILKNTVQNEIFTLIRDSKSIDDTRNNIKNNIDNIDNLVKSTLKELDYDKKYVIKYGNNYFPKKEYKGSTYKEGKYESLVITLGDGQGDNWWCVLFPPYCLMESENQDNKEVEYTTLFEELLDKIKHLK